MQRAIGKRLVVSIVVCAVVMPAAAEAAETSGGCGPAIGNIFGGGGGIPDGGSTVIGPAETAGTTCILDVGVQIDLFHSLVGDLTIRVGYDRDCDGTVDTEEVTLMCRPGRGCSSGSGRGCEAGSAGSYRFAGNESAQFADPCPSGIVPDECYGVLDGTADFSIFQGEQMGGCFWLTAEDAAAGDTGFIKAFIVTLAEQTCAVPVEEASWGIVKARYDD